MRAHQGDFFATNDALSVAIEEQRTSNEPLVAIDAEWTEAKVLSLVQIAFRTPQPTVFVIDVINGFVPKLLLFFDQLVEFGKQSDTNGLLAFDHREDRKHLLAATGIDITGAVLDLQVLDLLQCSPADRVDRLRE